MSRHKRKLSVWEHYLAKELGIEFKACLYFFCILFFYAMYRLLGGSREADIIHMAEMIILAYVIGYVQVYLLSNFDEGECLGTRETCYALLCSLIYTGSSYLFGWFEREIVASLIFEVYILLVYACAFLVYRSKRKLDEKLLNEELRAFKERKSEKVF